MYMESGNIKQNKYNSCTTLFSPYYYKNDYIIAYWEYTISCILATELFHKYLLPSLVFIRPDVFMKLKVQAGLGELMYYPISK